MATSDSTAISARSADVRLMLRAIALCTASVNLALSVRVAVIVILLVEPGLSPGEIGIAMDAAGLGGLLGGVLGTYLSITAVLWLVAAGPVAAVLWLTRLRHGRHGSEAPE